MAHLGSLHTDLVFPRVPYDRFPTRHQAWSRLFLQPLLVLPDFCGSLLQCGLSSRASLRRPVAVVTDKLRPSQLHHSRCYK